MRFLLNCISLHEAGGLTVGLNFAKHILQADENRNNFIIVAPAGMGYEAFNTQNARVLAFPRKAFNNVWRFWFDQVCVPAIIRKHCIDALFTLTNIPTFYARCPQLLMLQRAHFVYPEIIRGLNRLRRYTWKDRTRNAILNLLFRFTLRGASYIIVQTEVMKRRLAHFYNINPEKIGVIATAGDFSSIGVWRAGPSIQKMQLSMGSVNLLCLSRYYPHKNIEILLDVAMLLKKTRRNDIRFFITIEKFHHRNAANLIERIETQGLGEIIVNLGAVSKSEVPLLYKEADGFILPTLMESYGLIYDEALEFGKIVLTSRRDFADDVVGRHGIYFDPLSPESILKAIDSMQTRSGVIEAKNINGSGDRGSWEITAVHVLDILKRLGSTNWSQSLH